MAQEAAAGEPHPEYMCQGGPMQRTNILALRFVDMCDAMLYARTRGKAFGLSIAEFSVQNKPISAPRDAPEKMHKHVFKKNAYWYTNADMAEDGSLAGPPAAMGELTFDHPYDIKIMCHPRWIKLAYVAGMVRVLSLRDVTKTDEEWKVDLDKHAPPVQNQIKAQAQQLFIPTIKARRSGLAVTTTPPPDDGDTEEGAAAAPTTNPIRRAQANIDLDDLLNDGEEEGTASSTVKEVPLLDAARLQISQYEVSADGDGKFMWKNRRVPGSVGIKNLGSWILRNAARYAPEHQVPVDGCGVLPLLCRIHRAGPGHCRGHSDPQALQH